jgi:hypothetical protein
MPEEYDSGFELLPADGADITADEELEAALGNIPDPDEDEVELPLGRGWAFDFEQNEFIRSGTDVLGVSAFDNLRMWIEKTLRTARYAHPIYSDDYGMETPWDLIGRQVTPDVLGRYSAAVSDALQVHDRISKVKDFTFTYETDDDALFVGFTVVVDEGPELIFDPFSLGGF